MSVSYRLNNGDKRLVNMLEQISATCIVEGQRFGTLNCQGV